MNAIAEAAGVALHVGSMGEVAGASRRSCAARGLANAHYSDSYLPAMLHYTHAVAPPPVERLVDGVAVLEAPPAPGLGVEPDLAIIRELRAARPWVPART